MRKSRRWLTVLLAAGLIGLGASSGTFATFTATTTNPGNTFATGSLTLSNTANAGTACFSFDGTHNSSGANKNDCSSVLTLDNTANYPGGPIALGAVTVANVGTINASQLNLYASSGCTDSSATDFTGADISQSGSTWQVTPGSNANLDGVGVGMSVTATASSVSILPNGVTATAVTTDSSGNVTAVDLSSGPASVGPYTDASVDFTLGSLGTTPALCENADVFIEEYAQGATSGGTPTALTYCWYGSCPASGGQGLVGSQVTGGGTSAVNVSLANSATMSVHAGDSLVFLEPDGADVVGTAATTASSASTLSVDFPSSDTLPAGTAIIDQSTQPTGGTSATLAGFTTTLVSVNTSVMAPGGSGTELAPLTGTSPGAGSPAATGSQLAAGASRSFIVGVYLPTGSSDNAAQDALASFGLTWQISQ